MHGIRITKRPAREAAGFVDFFKGVQVLLVEDNVANQMVAMEILDQAGFVVEVADNGLRACEMVSVMEFAVVLMDLQMPEMDGLEATTRIRKTLSAENLPIIAMTANAMRGDREKCLSAGMNDYVSKPIDAVKLLGVLKNWIPAHKLPHAVAGENTSQIKTSPLVSLPGIDVSKSLTRLGISWDKFQKILFEFERSQPREMEDLRQALESEDLDGIRLKAHSLAGIGGNIAAESLRTAAKAVEKAASAGQTRDLAALFEALEKEFDLVRRSISTLDKTADVTSALPNDSIRNPIDIKKLTVMFNQLRECIHEFDPVGVETIMEKVNETDLPADIKPDYDQLKQNLGDLQYENAEIQLTAIQEKINQLKEKRS